MTNKQTKHATSRTSIGREGCTRQTERRGDCTTQLERYEQKCWSESLNVYFDNTVTRRTSSSNSKAVSSMTAPFGVVNRSLMDSFDEMEADDESGDDNT